MDIPRNRHCANYISALSFPIQALLTAAEMELTRESTNPFKSYKSTVKLPRTNRGIQLK